MIHHLTAVWKFRHFLLALVRLDLRLRYRRSILGVGWSLLNPIAMTAVFGVVFCTLLGGGDIPRYIAQLLLGMAVWGFLRESAVQGCRALISNESYIRQSPLPYGLYPLRTVLGQAIHSTIALAVGFVGVMVVTAVTTTPTVQQQPAAMSLVWIVPGLVLSFLAAWAVATIFAFINVYFQDTQHLLEVAAQIVFFVSPIIHDGQGLRARNLGWMVDLNPVTLFLGLVRGPIMDGQPPTADLLVQGTAFTAVLIGLAAGTTAWLQKRVVFHL